MAPSILRRILDALLPARCPLCRRFLAGEVGLCEACLSGLGPARVHGHVVFLGGYHGSLDAAVRALKFGSARAVAGPVGQRLALGMRAVGWRPDALVPVPLHARRQRERGFNQSALVASVIGAELGVPVLEALTRTRPTRRQARLPAAERRRNVEGAFARRLPVAGLDLVLVDDVHTSGATAEACRRALLAGGARRVRLAVIARA